MRALVVAVVLLLSFNTFSQDSVRVKRVLSLGPVPAAAPATLQPLEASDAVSKILDYDQLEIEDWRPAEGDRVGENLVWRALDADDGKLEIDASDSPLGAEVRYFAFYVETDRFMEVTVEAKSTNPFALYFDGEKLGANAAVPDEEEPSAKNASGVTSVPQGKYLVALKVVVDPDLGATDELVADVKVGEEFAGAFRITTDATRHTSIDELLYDPKLSSVSISADGTLAAVVEKTYDKATKKSSTETIIYRVKDGSRLATLAGGDSFSQFAWLPNGARYAYVADDPRDGKTVWVADPKKGIAEKAIENAADLQWFRFAPDESFVVYSTSVENEEDADGVERLETPMDRWPWFRNKNRLHFHDLASGVSRMIVDFDASVGLSDISPSGDRLLLTTAGYDFATRPYGYTNYYVYHTATHRLDSLMSEFRTGGGTFSPDGAKLLITGGPSAFGELGSTLPEDVIPNDYDNQAYLYDFETGAIEPLSKEFKPTISSVFWSPTDGKVYLRVVERNGKAFYRMDVETKRYEKIELEVEALDAMDVAAKSLDAIYYGSSATVPDKAYLLDLTTGASRLLHDPSAESYEKIELGMVEEWSFVNDDGRTIDGLIYYPPDFTQDKDYPLIVYYYGGTSPSTRDFEGRYPKNLWAAHGYVVYVLQPSGATGYGQEFSALHVNDWGEQAGADVIKGVEEFLEAHPFVTKIGCIGASFGGFMTMSLVSKTDLFDAAAAHAGISALSSYWGEGYWGFLYSSVATAESFPWNRRDIYVDKSPLYSADKINTPILLLHGADDTNVPPGES
ncbi:MAG: prolyl oligopeptidase family serine peptidase, partial [Ignavibacteriales bacterium]|nr:prolyl oligopeptidase family serine peptidase [Ignavibacteriales bacterium]